MKWNPTKVAVKDLKPAHYNPRKTNKKAKKSFEDNLERYGNLEEIVVNKNLTIIGGHQRYFIAVENDVEEMEVFMPDVELTEEQEIDLNIKLNSINGWTVASLLLDEGFTNSDLKALGFREFSLPEKKKSDVAVVEVGKEKNKSLLSLFFPQDELVEVQRIIKKVMIDEELESVSETIKYLSENYA